MKETGLEIGLIKGSLEWQLASLKQGERVCVYYL